MRLAIQHNEGTNDYSVFFGFKDKNGSYIQADADALIRITDKEGNELYNNTQSVTKDDFSTFTSEKRGEAYLAEIRIPEQEIKEGKSSDGTLYLTVSNEKYFSFDEVNCKALFCLPVADIQVESGDLPIEIQIKDYRGEIASRLMIEKTDFQYNKELNYLELTVYGQKTFGKSDFHLDSMICKIYDSEGYEVESTPIYLDSLKQGDKFKDSSVHFYNVTPGETYTLQFSADNY